MYASTLQKENSRTSKSSESLLGRTGDGNLEIWAFAVLIERFRKVSGNSLKLVATHLLVHGVNY